MITWPWITGSSGTFVAIPTGVTRSKNDDLSFLPLFGGKKTQAKRARGPREPGGREVITHKQTTDPRYVVRMVESGDRKGRRIRSTLLIERDSGRIVDFLHLASTDDGQTWKVLSTSATDD